MKTTIPEQYLTDYALNELGPEERIYVEALLSASEESREEVCQIVDLAMLLNVGFEQEEEVAEVTLTEAQRRFIGETRQPNVFQRNIVAILAVAACVAVAVINLDDWNPLAPRLSKRSAVAGRRAIVSAMNVSPAGRPAASSPSSRWMRYDSTASRSMPGSASSESSSARPASSRSSSRKSFQSSVKRSAAVMLRPPPPRVGPRRRASATA